MLAPVLVLLLSMAASAGPEAAPRAPPRDDNAARAKRGLLPRKVARVRPSTRRIVIVPPAPTYLGEPEPIPEPVLFAQSAAEGAEPPRVNAAVSGVEADVFLRFAPAER